MDYLKKHALTTIQYIRALAKWVIVSGLVGLTGGLVGTMFHWAIDVCTDIRIENPWIILFLPIAGLIIVWIYRLEHVVGCGTNTVIESIQSGEKIPAALIPAIFAGSVLTHLAGGSAGREGAALQLGGGIGYNVGRLLRLDDRDIRMAVLCGMSGLFSALFGTPITATIFAIEVISVGIVYYAALVPCLLSAIIGSSIASLCGVAPTSYVIASPAGFEFGTFIAVACMACIFAVVSILFCFTMRRGESFIEKFLPNPYVRAFTGGLVIIALTGVFGVNVYNGAGMDVIADAMDGTARPEAFFLKIVFTAITIGCGFKGGEVVPTFFIGATLGCVLGPVFGVAPEFSAALGLVSLFCGVVNCPVTSMFLALELFGGGGAIYFAVSCAFSYMLSGYYGLYPSQKIVYSKLKTEFINTKAR